MTEARVYWIASGENTLAMTEARVYWIASGENTLAMTEARVYWIASGENTLAMTEARVFWLAYSTFLCLLLIFSKLSSSDSSTNNIITISKMMNKHCSNKLPIGWNEGTTSSVPR